MVVEPCPVLRTRKSDEIHQHGLGRSTRADLGESAVMSSYCHKDAGLQGKIMHYLWVSKCAERAHSHGEAVYELLPAALGKRGMALLEML